MTYLVDGRSLQDRSAVRGIGTYVRGLLSGYAEIGIADHIELLIRRGEAPPNEVADLGLHRSRAHIPTLKRRVQPVADPFMVAAVVRRLRPTLYHGVDYAQPVHARVPVVITVHDLIPFIFPRQYPWLRRERLLALRLLAKADALIADSGSTASDVERLGHVEGNRIHVVPLAVAAHFRPASTDAVAAVRAKYGLSRRFVLAVGTFDPRKRIDHLAAATAQLRRHHDVDVVIAGSQGEFDGRVRAAMDEKGLTNVTHFLGFVPTDDLVALYAAADALLFTSEYEGFGLPPLEAMACGAAVVMFDNSSLREIAGGSAVTVSDGNPRALGDATAALLSDDADRARRRAAGIAWAATFTWRRTAEQTLGVYESTLRNRA